MLVPQDPRVTSISSIWEPHSASFQPILILSTYSDKTRPCCRWTNRHSQFGTSPIQVPIELFQIVSPTMIQRVGDHTDSVQEEPQHIQCLTKIVATCAVVDESKCLDTPIWEFSIICEHLPFLLGCKPVLRLLLVHRNPAIWRWYPWSWLLSFEMLKILVQWILHKNLSRLLQYHLGVQLDLCIFGALPPIQHFSNDTCPLMMQNELLRPTSLLHRLPLSYLWLSSGSTPKISPIFPIPCPPLPLLQEFSKLEAQE